MEGSHAQFDGVSLHDSVNETKERKINSLL